MCYTVGMNGEDSRFAPYGSPENIERIFDKFRRNGLPSRVTADYLLSLGIGEGMIPRNLATLSFLGLVDTDSAPTQRLKDMVTASDDEWRALFQATLRESYPMIFRAVNPEHDERIKVFNAFRPMTPQSQWNRMTTLFLGLCRLAGMDVKEPPNQRPGKDGPVKPKSVVRATARIRQGRQTANATGVVTAPPHLALPPAPEKKLDPALVGIVGKIADLETAEDLEAWIAMFRAAFAFVKKVRLQ